MKNDLIHKDKICQEKWDKKQVCKSIIDKNKNEANIYKSLSITFPIFIILFLKALVRFIFIGKYNFIVKASGIIFVLNIIILAFLYLVIGDTGDKHEYLVEFNRNFFHNFLYIYVFIGLLAIFETILKENT